jgi:large subunit ribosomal protein L25
MVPGVVYGHGGDAKLFSVVDRELRVVLSEGHALFDLEIEGQEAVPVVVKEQQYHPVKGDVIHMDFLEVNLDEKIEAEVSLELEGTEQAPGVREGGVLEHVLREVTVEALPTEIPEVLVVDVSGMEINDNVTLEAVVAPEGVTIVADDPSEVTVATLSPPRVEEEPEPSAEEETELIGEEGEAAEGEEAAGGEGGEESGDGESEDSGSGDEEG